MIIDTYLPIYIIVVLIAREQALRVRVRHRHLKRVARVALASTRLTQSTTAALKLTSTLHSPLIYFNSRDSRRDTPSHTTHSPKVMCQNAYVCSHQSLTVAHR